MQSECTACTLTLHFKEIQVYICVFVPVLLLHSHKKYQYLIVIIYQTIWTKLCIICCKNSCTHANM